MLGRPLRLVADLVVPAPPPIARALLLALTLGLIAAVGAYCARRLHECAAEGRRVLFEPWGQLMLVGTAVLGLTEVFERPLGRLSCCPRTFVEEGLELIGSLWCSSRCAPGRWVCGTWTDDDDGHGALAHPALRRAWATLLARRFPLRSPRRGLGKKLAHWHSR